MRVNDIKKVKPAKDYVVVKNIELDADNKLYFAKEGNKDLKNAELSYGEVLSVGPEVGDEKNCPGLTPGHNVVFNRYAGSHIATDELNELYKVMSGYSLIAILYDLNNLNEDTIHPTANRLLLAVKFVDQGEDGLFLDAKEAKDPRLEDLDYGTVISVGPSCKLGYKVGDIVAYQPYAGENIRAPLSVEKPALRVLIEEDVLLFI